jgi:hypothetical protein
MPPIFTWFDKLTMTSRKPVLSSSKGNSLFEESSEIRKGDVT